MLSIDNLLLCIIYGKYVLKSIMLIFLTAAKQTYINIIPSGICVEKVPI